MRDTPNLSAKVQWGGGETIINEIDGIGTVGQPGDRRGVATLRSGLPTLLQHTNTRELFFRIPDLITYIFSITRLQPGDIISTGTPVEISSKTPPVSSIH
jgi:hypothetical protein